MGIKTNNIEITGGLTLNGVNIFDKIYPVGSLYLSATNTNPKALFGGTWIQIKDQFILAAGDIYHNGDTGGSASHSHNLSSLGYAKISITWTNNKNMLCQDRVYPVTQYAATRSTELSNGFSDTNQVTMYDGVALAGKTNSENILPPYMVAYVWKRIA